MILHLPVSPIYDKNFIAITLQTSNFFAPYASVTIQSILEHAADDFCYDIIVMTWDMKAETAEKLTAMANGRRNISIRVVDVSNEIESYVAIAKKRSDYERFSATGVIRLLLPELLTEFDKILNLDCDMVLCADAAELDTYDLSEYYMGGVPDTICYVLNRRSGEKQFTDELLFEKLKLDSAADYVNAGLLLLNLKNIRRDFSTDEIMEFAQNDGTFFTCYEQDTFNGLFRKKKLKLPAEWNWLFEPYFYEELKKLPAQDMISSAYIKAAKCQKNIHFVGQVKPWSSANRPFGNTWWFLARKSPLFDEILNRVDIKQNVKLRKTSKVRQKRLLFCAETPFELLTAMNLKYHYYIIRTSWMFGSGANFVDTISELGRKQKTVFVVDDQIGSPTYAEDLAKCLLSIIEKVPYGVYHVMNEGYCSWAELAEAAFRMQKISATVHRISSQEYGGVVKRPQNSRLSKECLDKYSVARLPQWEDGLRRYLEKRGLYCGR